MCIPRLCLAVSPQAPSQVVGGVRSHGAARSVPAKARRQRPANHAGWLLAVWLGCGILADAAPPVATPDTYESRRNVVLYVGAPGLPEVLANDSDADGDQLIAVKVTDPAHGTLVFHDDGRFEYTPDNDYVGTDSFTYKVNDAAEDSNVATVTIGVRARDWAPFGAGVGGSVFALTFSTSGDLYVGGDFVTAGGVAAGRIAKWDGDSWFALGSGMNGAVRALAQDALGNLYAGGPFSSAGGLAASSVAKWDGANWHALGAGVNGDVRALALDSSGALYVGGSFTSAGGVVANGLAKWDGTTWSALGTGTDGEVQALAIGASGALYVGGLFVNAGGVATNSIAKWDGTSWSALGTGMVGGGVSGLVFDDSGILYACGGFHTAGAADALHVAKWDGTAWSALCPPASELPGRDFYALASDAVGNVYAGGSFPDGPIRHAARWDGTRWLLLGSGLGDSVHALAVDAAGDLFAGGQFITAGGNPANHVAEYDVPTPPVAVADTYGADRNTALDVAAPGVLANDSDADGEALTAVKVTDPAHGVLALNANGSFTYTPNAGYAGPDSFTYRANDGVDDSSVATVTITVWDGDWDALGAEIDGTVYVLAHDALGNLYAGGEFSLARRAAANHIAKWDGTTWSALGEGMDGPVYSLAFDETGTLFAGGDFTLAGGVAVHHVARWDGATWSALGAGTDGYVNALAHDGMGNLYAGGDFTTAGGVVANRIAKWDGTAWSSLGSGMNNWVWALSFDAAGDLYAGGSFTTAGGSEARCVARWDGAAWSSLGTGLEARAWALAFDASGDLYVGAEFSTPDGAGAHRVARWDGSGWSYLGAEMNGEVYALAFGGSGDLYVGGSFTAAGGVAVSRIARWDGTAWRALGTGMDGCVWALTSDASGDLYAGGDFTIAAGIPVNRVAAYDIPSPPAAVADTCEAFRNTALVVTSPGLLGNDLDLDGDALVAVKVTDPTHGTLLAFNADGSFTYMPANDYIGPDSFVYRANDGVYDSAVVSVSIMVWDHVTWSAVGSGTSNSVRALTFDASGGLYVAGDFITAGGVEVNRIAAWDGTSWSALGTGMGGGSGVRALARGASGDLYAAGYFTTAGEVAANRVAMWDGASWSALGTGLGKDAQALTLDGLGNLYAGGAFTTAGGQEAQYVAKWDGGSWSPLGSGMGHYVYALACDASGSLYAGGYFTTAGGQPAAYIAKWDGASWSPLGRGMNDYVYALAFDASGNLYAGGSFTSAGGVAANHVAKWDGATWSPLGPGVNWRVGALAFGASGDLYVGGMFSAAGTVAVNRAAKWDGMSWSPLGSGMDDQVGVLACSPSGVLYAGGDFTTAGGTAAAHLAKYEVPSLPVATADAYETFRNAALDLAIPGVLANDTDLSGDPLTAVKVADPTHGTVVLRSDGSFLYTPDEGYVGDDTFTYQATDGVYDSNTATVAITVTNRSAVAIGDAYDTDRGTPLAIPAPGVLANDSDADGDVLTAVKVSDTSHGDLTLNADGSFTYTPDADHAGTDSFTYQANDGTADSDVVTVTIAVWNGRWSALDSEVDGRVAALVFDAAGNLYAGGQFVTAGGIVVNHIAKWDGTSWSALGTGLTDGVWLGSTVRALALDGSGNLYAGGDFRTAGGIAARNIAKWDGSTWSALGTGVDGMVTALVHHGTGGLYVAGDFGDAGGVSVGQSAKWDGVAWSALGTGVIGDFLIGALAVDAAGSLYAGGTFGFAGETPANNVAKWDGTDWSALGSGIQGEVNVLAVDGLGDLYAGGVGEVGGGDGVLVWDGAAWSALAEGRSGTGERWTFPGGVHALAFDASGNLYAGSVEKWDGNMWTGLGSGVNGAVEALAFDASGVLYAAGDFTIAGGVAANYIAKWETFQPPVAVADTYETFRNATLEIAAPGVLANDTDPNGDPLTVSRATDPAHGTLLSFNSDGSFTYRPDDGYVGDDSFTYKANDGLDDANVATVTITVANRAPAAQDAAYGLVLSSPWSTSLVVPPPGVLANDSDPDGDALTAVLVEEPGYGPFHGDLVCLPDGSFVYTAYNTHLGEDTFTYRAFDGVDYSSPATVTVTVHNGIPVAAGDAYDAAWGTPKPVTAPGVLANDSDPNGDPLAAVLVTGPGHGELVFPGDGSFVYTGIGDYTGEDTFTYKAFDGIDYSSEVTVTVTVTNDAPVAMDDTYEALRNVVLYIGGHGTQEVLANDSDADGDQLVAVKVTDPAHGTVIVHDDGAFNYTPAADYVGTDTFTYKANDAVADSNVATVTIKVRARDWFALGEGVGSPVSALACGSPGDLYVGGSFTTAGGGTANRIARWDGSDWHALGLGVGDQVHALAWDGASTLYVGGSFATAGGVAANHVAKWDGISWHPLGAGVNGSVQALALDASGALYVGGSFSSAGGVAANGVAKWDGVAWSALGAGVNDEVKALAVGASGELYVGGSFSFAGGVAANSIAKWNGTSWGGLGTGMAGGGVSGLALGASGILYACGEFAIAGGADALHIAKWDGTAWSALGQGDSELVGRVFHTVVCDAGGNLYAGGWFPDVVINHVARWNGTQWFPVGSGVGDHVQALAVDAVGDLYAGGQFTTAGGFGPNGFNTPGNPANHVAKYDIPCPPVAVPDTYDANVDTVLHVAAPGVLANDRDADGEVLAAVKVTDPDHGTLTLNADGSFSFTPDAGFVGTDSFTYQAKDGVDDSAVATATITVLQTYRLTVTGGSGQGSYPAGVGVLVTTGDPPAGLVFAGWTVDPGEYAANLANPNAESTTFTMPAKAVTLGFIYRPPENKLDVIPVALAAASATDKSAVRPTGLSGVTVGDTFVVELWAKNRDGSAKWLTVGGADLSYDTALLDAEAGGLYHGATYNTLTQGTVDDATGLVDEFGGGVAVGFEDPELGTTHWARIGGATFVATAAGDAAIVPAAATTFQWFRKDGGGTEAIAWADVPLEGINVEILADPRTPDPSGDDLCNLTDYGYFVGCYGKASGDGGWLPYGPACDYNRDGVVNLIDYGYFLGFYGKPSEQWQMPSIGRDGGREIRLEVVAVAVSAASALDKATVLPTGLDSVAVADTFVVELWVKNADASPSWISVGGVDVGYTTSAVDVDALHHGGVYVNLPQGVIDDANGLVDEFGGGVAAGTADTELGTSHWARLGHLQVMATAVGTAQFTPSAATTAQFFRNDPFAAISWSEAQFTGASLTVTPAPHSVTFCPGAHGTIPAANNGTDYVVTVADGGTVPAAPAVAAAAGWQLAGWDWLPTRRGQAPPTITQDWTATALYEEATPDWSVDLVLTGLAPAALTFGMRSDATDGWDAGVDAQYPLPVAGQACLASGDLALSYSTDLRAPARTAEFLLIASAAIDTTATVAWDVSALPDGTYLTIYEVLLAGVTPSREPVARELVGCTALNMALVQSLDIPAGETRCYVIRYGDDLVFDLSFLRGWNLVSLPIEPMSPALDLVLGDGQSRAADDTEMRDGLRGAIHSGSVWTWAGLGYVAVTEMHACVGYWVYAPESAVVLVNGTPGNQAAFDLKRGWNQCGVEVACPTPDDPCVVGTPWGWRPLALRYEPVGVLCPGLGYWINASEDSIVPLSARSGE